MNFFKVYLYLLISLPLPVISFANPIVDLGPDATVCGSYILDAENSGSTYLWSTGATTQQITVTGTGVYWVDVTDNTGTTRDSIALEILTTTPAPIVSDMTFCGAGKHVVDVQNSADFNIAYTSLSGDEILGIGRPELNLDLSTSQTVYIATAQSIQQNIGPSEAQGLASNLTVFGARGEFFDVHQTIIIDSVDIFAVGDTEIKIELKDENNQVLEETTVSVEGEGKHSIPLGFVVSPGEKYSLIGTPNNFLSYIVPGATYPYSIPGIMDITRSTHPSNLTVAYYFFDWSVSYWGCSSERVETQLSIAENPEVNLGADRANCGPEVLSALSSNATYLWSTGETTPSIVVDVSATVSVSATIGNCISRDTVALEILEEPIAPIVQNKETCGPEEVNFVNQSPSDFTVWYDSEVGGNIVGTGDTLSTKLNQNTTFYVASSSTTALTIGEKEALDNELDLFANGARGIIFDVMEPIILEQISVFADIPLRLFVELQDAEGNVLQTTNKWIPRGEGNESIVPLNFLILPGTDYRLIGYPQSFGRLAYLFPDLNFPYEIPDVISIKRSTHPTRFLETYYTFFNWVVKYPRCTSERMAVSYEVNIPLNLGDSTYTCDTKILDTGLPNMNHSWSTGSTASSIQVNQPGTYWVEINDGQGCVVRDSVKLNFPTPLNLGEDGVLCGNEILSGYDVSSQFLWNTGDTTATISITQPGTYSLRVIEPLGCELTDEITITSFDDFPEVDLGIDQLVCGSAVLDAGNPGMRYEWSHGPTTQTVEVSSTGSYAVTVYNDNGCATSDTINVSTIQSPASAFSYSKNGLSVSFNNLSSFGNYNWNFGDGGISQDINPNHTYIEPGTYQVRLIVSNDCSSDTMIQSVTVAPVGIFDQNWDGDITVYPNPTKGALNIQFEALKSSKDVQLRLLDMRGKSLYQEELKIFSRDHAHHLDLSRFPAGIYILDLMQENSVYRQKVILE